MHLCPVFQAAEKEATLAQQEEEKAEHRKKARAEKKAQKKKKSRGADKRKAEEEEEKEWGDDEEGKAFHTYCFGTSQPSREVTKNKTQYKELFFLNHLRTGAGKTPHHPSCLCLPCARYCPALPTLRRCLHCPPHPTWAPAPQAVCPMCGHPRLPTQGAGSRTIAWPHLQTPAFLPPPMVLSR